MIIPFNLTATNEFGTSMVLSGQTPEFLVEYSGFDAPQMNMMSIDLYNMDGAMYQGSKAQPRSIILDAYIFNHVTFWRTKLYETFIAGKEVTLRYEKDGNVRLITGVVDKITTPQFEQPQRGRQNVQIGLVCYDPWWRSPDHVFELSAIGSGNPLNIVYQGQYPSGIKAVITANASIYAPIISVIKDGVEEMVALDLTLSAGDSANIDTDKKTLTVTSNGTTTNAIASWYRGGQWIKLKPGENYMVVTSITGNANSASAVIRYSDLYQGV